MQKKLYIHVGPHKTGTTLIQKICLDNQSNLQVIGINYPNVFFNFLGHHGLIDKARNKSILPSEIEQIKSYESNILLSSENFIDLNENNWNYLKEVFHDFDIQIIYAWRRSSLKMYSMWQEAIKHGENQPFQEYYYQDLVKPGISRRLMQSINIDMLSKVFQKEKIHILDYDSLKEKGTLVENFFNLISVNSEELNIEEYHHGIKNQALKPSLTELLRCLNSYHQQLGNKPDSMIRELFFLRKENLREEINSIENIMQKSIKPLEFGHYFVDNNTDKQLVNRYSQQIIGYEKHNNKNHVDIITPNWLITPSAFPLLKDIYQSLTQ